MVIRNFSQLREEAKRLLTVTKHLVEQDPGDGAHHSAYHLARGGAPGLGGRLHGPQ